MSEKQIQAQTKADAYRGFIDAVDIGYGENGGGSKTYTIAELANRDTVKCADGKIVDKPVLYFKETNKGLILGKFNLKALILLFGKSRDDWSGKPVNLCVRFGNWFGQMDVPAVRVQLPTGVPMTFAMRKYWGKSKPSGGEK